MTTPYRRPPATTPDLTLDDAIGQLAGLSTLSTRDRVVVARRLALLVPATLAALADDGVYTLTRHNSYAEVADKIGVTQTSVSKAVQRHTQRTEVHTPG